MKFEIKPRSTPPLVRASKYFDLVSALLAAHARQSNEVIVVTADPGEQIEVSGIASHVQARTRRVGGPFRLRHHQLGPRQIEFWLEQPEGITPEELEVIYARGATPRYRGGAYIGVDAPAEH